MITRKRIARRFVEVYMQLINHPPGAGRDRLAWLMKKNNVSQRRLAVAVRRSSHTFIGRLLSGEVTTCSPELATRIARFFDVPVEDLFVTKVSIQDDQSGRSKRAA